MAIKIVMPQGGQDLTHGRIVRWLVKEGQRVEKGEVIGEVETEKATFDVTAPQPGFVLGILAQEGEEVEILSTIAYLGEEGEAIPFKGVRSEKQSIKDATQPISNPAVEDGDRSEGLLARLAISPKARKLASEHGISLDKIRSGRMDGKVTVEDVEEVIRAQQAGEALAGNDDAGKAKILKPDRVRRVVARRMQESWSSTPHIFVTRAVDMGPALKYRKENTGLDFSINDMIIRACALSLVEFPEVNASYHNEDTIYLWQDIHIGIAVSVNNGLIVSVIENADRLDLSQLAAETKRVIALTREGKQNSSQPSRFTISNLGMHGVDHFTAIINPPEAAILAVSSIQKTPVVLDDGTLAARDMMNLTLSMDHRVNDGVMAASFINAVKHRLENPQEL